MIENFLKWMKKHDYFISGIIVILNIGASIQSYNREDYTWSTISLLVALAFWYTYIKNVNKGEHK
jgi:hypothetical protein